MEYVQKYWYLVVGALILLFFVSRRSGGQVTQIGGNDATTLALAQMASAERGADLDRQFGFASTFLNYDIASRQTDQQLDLAKIQADANAAALASQNQLAQLAYSMQNQQYNNQLSSQQYAIQQQASAQRRNDYLGIIGTGIQSILPAIFGNSVSGGGWSDWTIGGGFGGNNAPTYRQQYPLPPSVINVGSGGLSGGDLNTIGSILGGLF